MPKSQRSSKSPNNYAQMERAAKVPGPGDYDIPRKKQTMGGRLSPNGRDQDRSDSRTDNRAGPGPGQYPISFEMPRGGRFLAGKRSKTALEMELYNKSRIPGPGMYEPGTGKKRSPSHRPSMPPCHIWQCDSRAVPSILPMALGVNGTLNDFLV